MRTWMTISDRISGWQSQAENVKETGQEQETGLG